MWWVNPSLLCFTNPWECCEILADYFVNVSVRPEDPTRNVLYILILWWFYWCRFKGKLWECYQIFTSTSYHLYDAVPVLRPLVGFLTFENGKMCRWFQSGRDMDTVLTNKMNYAVHRVKVVKYPFAVPFVRLTSPDAPNETLICDRSLKKDKLFKRMWNLSNKPHLKGVDHCMEILSYFILLTILGCWIVLKLA